MPALVEQRFGFVIPVYNHGATLEAVVKSLVSFNFPIIVVDDGNDEKNKAFINDIANRYPLITLLVHRKNKGKGEAMKTGVRKAEEMGLTHILQGAFRKKLHPSDHAAADRLFNCPFRLERIADPA